MSTRCVRAGVFLVACAISLCACEQRVVRHNPFLGGLPGAQSGTPVVRSMGNYTDPGAIPPDQIVQEQEDGSRRLVTRSARHLMIHIHTTLDRGDKDLFVEQVLSAITRAECLERGIDPGDTFDFLLTKRPEIDALFRMMPNGERTPGLFLRPLGGKTYRLQVEGLAAKDLYWRGFDMVMEQGHYRLRWFVR